MEIHWNYFDAIEEDVIRVARFVEFSKDNFNTYSIELARILMSSASEADVVAKLLCKKFEPSSNPRNLNDYANIILPTHPKLSDLEIIVPRYGLTLDPWSSWTLAKAPSWWTAYNGVKHQRDTDFPKANLINALNAVAGLFALIVFCEAGTWPESILANGDVVVGSNLSRIEVVSSYSSRTKLFKIPTHGLTKFRGQISFPI
jgi:hypothetical protein